MILYWDIFNLTELCLKAYRNESRSNISTKEVF